MFTRGLQDYMKRGWEVDNWLYDNRTAAPAASVIPGVSNKTAAVAAGGTIAAGVGIWALGKALKWW